MPFVLKMVDIGWPGTAVRRYFALGLMTLYAQRTTSKWQKFDLQYQRMTCSRLGTAVIVLSMRFCCPCCVFVSVFLSVWAELQLVKLLDENTYTTSVWCRCNHTCLYHNITWNEQKWSISFLWDLGLTNLLFYEIYSWISYFFNGYNQCVLSRISMSQ